MTNNQKYKLEHRQEIKEQQIIYRQNHQEEIKEIKRTYYKNNREKILKKTKKYNKSHKEEKQDYNKQYREKNKKQLKEQKKLWYQENKEKIKITQKINRRNWLKNPINRLTVSLRHRVYMALKGYCKSAHTQELIGCSIDYLKIHLEKQFIKGMSWSNYGKWHVDHIQQCCKFDLNKKSEQFKCFNYTNLRPLWANDNLERPRK